MALENFYDFADTELFHIGGERPQITIQTRGKRPALGWYSRSEIWDCAAVKRHEINISAETLNRPIVDTACTLLHEMVHHYNLVHGVQDVSRQGRWHNKKFKESAEKHGLIVSMGDKIGYSVTALGEVALGVVERAIASGILPADGIALCRQVEAERPKKPRESTVVKYECPECGATVRGKSGLRFVCLNCEAVDSVLIEIS
ncbi:hypothetical protein FACS1894211_02550 [Clostridia bacterium]|nr:hypothetical protein FACS1894211_02550 [Clostridia bacterium]